MIHFLRKRSINTLGVSPGRHGEQPGRERREVGEEEWKKKKKKEKKTREGDHGVGPSGRSEEALEAQSSQIGEEAQSKKFNPTAHRGPRQSPKRWEPWRSFLRCPP